MRWSTAPEGLTPDGNLTLVDDYGERNGEGIKALFRQALVACAFTGMAVTLLLLLLPNTVLLLYGIEDTPLRVDLVKCIRFCSLGVVAASIGGFLSDYYGYT